MPETTGSSATEWLDAEGIREECEAEAKRRVRDWKADQALERRREWAETAKVWWIGGGMCLGVAVMMVVDLFTFDLEVNGDRLLASASMVVLGALSIAVGNGWRRLADRPL